MKTTHRKYQGIEISKKQREVIDFIETGSNNFWNAYYNYNNRKMRWDRPTLTISSWFNKVVRSLHDKNLLKEIPFVLHSQGTFIWANPGINASKANFECIALHDSHMEMRSEQQKII